MRCAAPSARSPGSASSKSAGGWSAHRAAWRTPARRGALTLADPRPPGSVQITSGLIHRKGGWQLSARAILRLIAFGLDSQDRETDQPHPRRELMRPFRFGVMGGPGAPAELVRFVAPMLSLTLAATATTTLRLAGLVMNFDLRHAAVAASEWAALDVLSGGRAEPGFGAGWASDEYTATGMFRISQLARPSPPTRRLWSSD